MNCRWSLTPAQPNLAQELAAALRLSPMLAQCLLNRGVSHCSSATAFLEPRLKHLSDPFLLPDMEQAVQRLFRAREQGEALVVFGDYDVDGVTSTTLLYLVLTRLGWKVSYYLPHRLEEGYGLSLDAAGNCFTGRSATLLLAVDCGSNSASTIQWLKGRGIDTIVLDHHQVSGPPSELLALVNPHRQDRPETRFRELCSVGLAFKLAHAIVKYGRLNSWPDALAFDLRPLLDLVALGTIADLVPLTGENRILVSAGLEYLNRRARPGIDALARVSRISGRIGVYEVGFQLGPRLNAAGRLENALHALELLLALDREQADLLAQRLEVQNAQRQQLERGVTDQVIAAVKAKFNPDRDYVIVEGQLSWHLGVVGIVASRVLREFYRPTLIIGGDGEEWRGSGRSIEGFDLAKALHQCGDLLTRHGGHAMAAGLSLAPANLDPFRSRLNEIARNCLNADLLKPILRLDAEAALRELTTARLLELLRLEPAGQGNPAVQLVSRRLKHYRPPQRIGKDGRHARMWVTDGTASQQALWWNCADQGLPEGEFDLAYVPQLNQFNGQHFVQLKVLDWRQS